MGTSAIIMMVIAIGTVWGGLIGSVIYLTSHPMTEDD
ncbi:methionine/alanine import family NSS transporter small subunit [Arcanobacterium ihumii]|nr:methionine/alanine import family NSS transporter small subunit [Arcanobacterium ihumii]